MTLPSLLVWLCLASASAGDATLTLPDPLAVGVEQAASITVRDPGSPVVRLTLPNVDGVTWGEPQARGSQTTIINGVRSDSSKIAVPITCNREPGPLTMPEITLHLKSGGKLTTAPVTVTVSKPDPRLQGDGLVEAFFEPNTVVPGQPAALVLRVQVRSNQELTPGIAPPPEAVSLGEVASTTSTTVGADGADWFVQTWRWPIAVTTPGTFTVQGQQGILVATGRADFFGRQQAVRRQLPIRPASITVAALPAEGRPEDFTGLVGELRAEIRLDRDRIPAGEGAQLLLTVTGRQLDLLRAPKLAPPPGVQAYPRPSEDAANNRTFKWDLVPTAPGDYRLPGFSFPWFDPATRTYRRTATNELTLTVLPGRARTLTGGGSLQLGAEPAPQAAVAATLPPPLREAAPSRPPSWLALSALLGSLVLGGVLGLVQRWLTRPAAARHRGRDLLAAAERADLAGVAAALHALRGATLSEDQRSALASLDAVVERCRFGGEPAPPDLVARCRSFGDLA
ncbi:hypothetical protein LBMAG53_19450 [Planctomycetota bacterium]|nr:hypothetical protein LBMAG53_19450 [Planctomycetota bacterium]